MNLNPQVPITFLNIPKYNIYFELDIWFWLSARSLPEIPWLFVFEMSWINISVASGLDQNIILWDEETKIKYFI